MMPRTRPHHRTATLLLALAVLCVAPLSSAATVVWCPTGIVAQIHTAEEIAAQWLQRSDGRLYLDHPATGRIELITDIDDQRLIRSADRFYPFDQDIVAQALRDMRGFSADVTVDVFILPAPPVDPLASYAAAGNIFLAPGYGPVAAQTVAYTTTHEMGHVLTWAFLDASAARWQAYRSLRKIPASATGTRVPHAWLPREILAEDIRFLFGGSLATFSGSIENGQLPLPDTIDGLRELLAGFFTIAPSAGPIPAAGVAYPNPCNPATNVAMTLPTDAHPALAATAELRIFDIRGRLVQTVVGGRADADRVVVRWNGTDTAGRKVATGRYLYVLAVDDRIARGSLLVIK